jgi:hypothetical protein
MTLPWPRELRAIFGQEPTIPLDMALDNKSKGVRHGL